MLTSSKKAKGRKLQQTVRDALLDVATNDWLGQKTFDIEPGDIVSTGMGQGGVDVILSPAAKKIFGDIAIECKNQEALNVTGIYFEHAAKYPKASIRMLVHKRNSTEPLVTISLQDFKKLLSGYIRA